jgi:hypothetical protein
MSQRATPPTMPALSALQIEVAQSLALGMPVIQAADVAGVDRRTIQRWMKHDSFNQEVADRRALAAAGARLEAAKQVSQTGFDLPAALASLREAKRDTRLQVRECGSSILSKCCERLADLPIEAISPQLLPQYFKVGKELLEWADESEAQELEISELVEQLIGPDSLTAQKVQVATVENIERVFAAIADAPDFTHQQKERIFHLIAGKNHVPDPA